MRKVQQISRRTWLAQVALGSFAVWSELNFGLGRRGWIVAIGGSESHARRRSRAEPGADPSPCSQLGLRQRLRPDSGQGGGGRRYRHAQQCVKDCGRSAYCWTRLGCSAPRDPDALSSRSHWQCRRSTGAAAKATAYAGTADIAQIKSPRPLKAIGDNDEVFGLRVIATPGHTPGHICVFDPAGSLLILGDAMSNIGNEPRSQSSVHGRYDSGAPEY